MPNLSYASNKICPQLAGFEPTRAEPIGFQVQRLNHSATTAQSNCQATGYGVCNEKNQWRCGGSNPGPFTCKANALPLSYIPFSTGQLFNQQVGLKSLHCTHGGTRTPNLRFRRPTPYPLGHAGTHGLRCLHFIRHTYTWRQCGQKK